MHHAEDFSDYEARLRAARRNAREAYVRYRSYCDVLDKLPVKAADADYDSLDTLDQLGGELRDLMASDFFV
jgi:hypothetical protein